MASVIGQHQFTTSPNIKISVARSIKREGKGIYCRWRTEVTALPNHSYPYSIDGTIVFNEYRIADAVELKSAYPDAWLNTIIDYYPSSTGWIYVGEVTDPAVTTLPVRVRFTSSANHVLHLEGEEEIPPFVLPTAPTKLTASLTNIGNKSTNFTLSWSGETKGTGTFEKYVIQYRIGTNSTWKQLLTGYGTTKATVNLSSISELDRGETVSFRVQLVDNLGFSTAFTEETANVYYAKLPTAPTYVKADKEVVAYATDNVTLSWSGASVDAGTITGYNVYYLKNGTWTRYTTTTGYSVTLNLSKMNVERGGTVTFCVTTLSSLSLESAYSSTLASVLLANMPTAPTWITVTPMEIKRNDMIDVTWGGATAGTGAISYYVLQYRRYHDGSWTDWTDAEYRSSEYCHCEPTKLFPDLQGNDLVDVRIKTVNTYNLSSESYAHVSSYIAVRGGGIRINVDGSWHEGTPYVNINGTWYIGETYVNVNGNWHEGI